MTGRAGVVLLVGLLACASPDTATTSTHDAGSSTVIETALPGTILVDGLAPIEALSPSPAGAGEVPVFRWRAVEGAVVYDLVVTGPDGPIWAWQGEATEVALGGLPAPRPPGLAGPVIKAGSCWSVVAWGSDGHVVAGTGLMPVSPTQVTSPCQPGETGTPR